MRMPGLKSWEAALASSGPVVTVHLPRMIFVSSFGFLGQMRGVGHLLLYETVT